MKNHLTFDSVTSHTTKHIFNKSVFIEVEKDGEGFCAFSEKYYRFLGYGKTRDDAVYSFVKGFTDKKCGEHLTNYYFQYS